MRLCSAWWGYQAAGKEALVSQTLPYLLVRALSAGALAAPVMFTCCLPIASSGLRCQGFGAACTRYRVPRP